MAGMVAARPVGCLSKKEGFGPRTVAEEAIAQRRHLPPRVRLALSNQRAGSVGCGDCFTMNATLLRCCGGVPESAVSSARLRFCLPTFATLRRLSNRTLAHDVTHMLNRYFTAIVDAMEPHGAYVDKYIGDGIMVLFGLIPSAMSTLVWMPCSPRLRFSAQCQNRIRTSKNTSGHRFVCGVESTLDPQSSGTLIVAEVAAYGAWRYRQCGGADRISDETAWARDPGFRTRGARAHKLPPDLPAAKSFVIGESVAKLKWGKASRKTFYPVRPA